MSIETESRTYSISDLSNEFDVTTRALRLYEESDLLAPERLGSKRIYSQRDRVRLRLILRGKRLGYTLSEIKDIFDMYDSESGEKGQILLILGKLQDNRQKLLLKKKDVDKALEEIERLDQKMQATLDDIVRSEQQHVK